jgi:hypothetical protein
MIIRLALPNLGPVGTPLAIVVGLGVVAFLAWYFL